MKIFYIYIENILKGFAAAFWQPNRMSSKDLRTANDYVQFALSLMQSTPPQYVAASCIFRFVHQNISESERPKVAKFLVQCGIALHDTSLMNYVSQIPMDDITQHAQLARFMLNTTIHEQQRDRCREEVDCQPEFCYNG